MLTRGLAIGATVLTISLTALWEFALLAGGGTVLSRAGLAPIGLWLVMAALIVFAERRAQRDMPRIAVPQHHAPKERAR